jgi:WD40 repeat protein
MKHPAGVLSVRFHPGGERVLVTACADGRARFWHPATGEPRGDSIPHPQKIIEAAVFTPDGRAVVTTCTDGLARWWEAAGGRPLGSALRHDVGMYGAAFDAAGTRVVTYSPDGTARLWAVAPAALPPPAPFPTALRAAVADDGSRAAAVSPSVLTVLDPATAQPVGPRRTVPQAVDTPVAFGPGGRRLAAVDRLKKLRVWEAGRPLIEVELPRKAHGLAFDPSGDRLAVVGDGGVVEVWDVPAGKAIRTLRHNGVAIQAAFDPTGRWLAVGAGEDPVARLWDLTGPTPTPADLPTAEGVLGVRFRPDGGALATRSGRVARLWDVDARRQLGPLIGPFDQYFQIEFTPDGRALVSWCLNRVRLWDATTAEPLADQTYDHPAAVDGVALDPTGALLVAALEDRTAQFWDLRTGRAVGPAVPIGARALAVGRSADTGRFFAVGDDGKVHPLALPAPATGSVAELAARLRRKTGFTMAAGTVSPLLVKDWEATAADGPAPANGP